MTDELLGSSLPEEPSISKVIQPPTKSETIFDRPTGNHWAASRKDKQTGVTINQKKNSLCNRFMQYDLIDLHYDKAILFGLPVI